ncbi:MAG: CinA family nicotinamide mononucleotide deamidase-related protein [Myxococcota bacterium]
MTLPKRIEVLAIGDELLDGRVADTNTLRFAKALSSIGLAIQQRTTILDDIETIVREARAIVARGCELCLVSGGLGPTRDDVTAEAFARLADVGLQRDPTQVERIERMLSFRGRAITENQKKQADRPENAVVIENAHGTAPGFALELTGCRFVSVPGVPREFDAMVDAAVIAPLRQSTKPREVRTLRCFGVPEAEVDARLASLVTDFPNVRQGYRAHFPEIHVTLRAEHDRVAELDEAFAEARSLLARETFTIRDESYAEVVLSRLRERGLRLALAESCTGGLIGDMLTDIPGSSDVLWGGGVVYANEAKMKLLGVSADDLQTHGAVSEEVVRQMVKGAQELSGCECAVSVSGIAGPAGGSEDKPVGTVWFGCATPSGISARRLRYPFDRRRNKIVSAYSALELLRRRVEEL